MFLQVSLHFPLGLCGLVLFEVLFQVFQLDPELLVLVLQLLPLEGQLVELQFYLLGAFLLPHELALQLKD